MTKFKIGDSVRVKAGTKDTDFQAELGGWQGRIIDIDTEENLVDVAWDSQTLLQIPKMMLDSCFREGYAIEGYTLSLDDVELAKPRDKEKDVLSALAEIYGRYGLEYNTDFEEAVLSLAAKFGVLDDDEEDWEEEESVRTFDLDQFFADLRIESDKEQTRIRSCFATGLEVYYEHIYGYRKYGRKPEHLINQRMGEPYIFGFGMVEALRAKRGIKETSKLAICQYTLQTAVPEEEYGVPHGLIVLASYLAETGYLEANIFRAIMQTTNLLRQWVWPWQIEEAIQLSNWLIPQEAIPTQEKLFWLWHFSMQFHEDYHFGKKLVNHWLAHPNLADSIKKELIQGWLDNEKLLGRPPAPWRLVIAQTTGDLAAAEEALKEMGASRQEIKQVKQIIKEESESDLMGGFFSHDPLFNFNPRFGYSFTPNWLQRIAVLALVKLGEDAWETAVLYLDSTRDYGAEALNMGVADILDEFAEAIPPAELRELIERGTQLPQVPTRKTFYRLSTRFYGTELLEKTAEDNAASIRNWGAKELKKRQA
ncbi:MAG: hypothetical protein R3D55_23120 [Chloroflexota bacterium]